MINDSLDIAAARSTLQRVGRAQIRDYLQPEAAAALERCLIQEVPWTLALRENNVSRTLPADELAALDTGAQLQLLERVQRAARGSYGFAYESYMMVDAYKAGRDPDLLLHRVLEFLNGAQHLAFLHALTGDTRIRRVSAQATRYRPGHFLKQHNDMHGSEGYLYAHVLNLTRDWTADWGGLLQFVDAQGAVEQTFMPRFNSLSVFRVPTDHVVSLVAPWAEDQRLAITGWYQS
ncbi:MAG: 2OG-Fe(II) oxygenase family protein [Lysobacterales bacterium]